MILKQSSYIASAVLREWLPEEIAWRTSEESEFTITRKHLERVASSIPIWTA